MSEKMLPRLEKDMQIISKLPDEPNDEGGLTAAQLKAKFDEAGQIIKDYLHLTLLPELDGAGVVDCVASKDTGVLKYLRVLGNGSLQYSADGETWRQLNETVIIPEQTLEFSPVDGQTYYRHDLTADKENGAFYREVKVGGVYCVEWDGVLYESVAFLPAEIGIAPGMAVLGNASILSSDYADTGEPFVFVGMDAVMDGAIASETDLLYVSTNDTSASHVVRLYKTKDRVVSPTVSITKQDGVTTVIIYDTNGKHTATILDGEQGAAGVDGKDGADGTDGTGFICCTEYVPVGATDVPVTRSQLKYPTLRPIQNGDLVLCTNGTVCSVSYYSDGYYHLKSTGISVKGADGAAGEQGPQGEQGLQGEQGPAGADGAQGEKGADGTNGKDGADGYTPVRGTDYWTAEDQAAIVADVLAALPVAEGGSF